MAARRDGVGDELAAHALDRRLPRGVDVHDHDGVGRIEGAGELAREALRARIAMGLEQHHHALEIERGGGGERRGHLGGMMGVVVDHGDARGRPHEVEPATHARIAGEALRRAADVVAERPYHAQHARRIERVVAAGAFLQAARRLGSVGEMQREQRGQALGAVIGHARVAAFREPVGHHAPPAAAGELGERGIFAAGHHRAVFGNRRHEPQERVPDFLDAARVVVEMVGFHVGDERHVGVEVEKRAVAFVGFDHVVIPRSRRGVGAVGVHDAAHHERGLETQRVEHTGALPHADAARFGLDELGIAARNGGRDHRHVAIGRDVGRVVSDEHRDARLFEPAGVARSAHIRAAHLHAQVGRDAGDAAHAHAADADEMDAFRF